MKFILVQSSSEIYSCWCIKCFPKEFCLPEKSFKSRLWLVSPLSLVTSGFPSLVSKCLLLDKSLFKLLPTFFILFTSVRLHVDFLEWPNSFFPANGLFVITGGGQNWSETLGVSICTVSFRLGDILNGNIVLIPTWIQCSLSCPEGWRAFTDQVFNKIIFKATITPWEGRLLVPGKIKLVISWLFWLNIMWMTSIPVENTTSIRAMQPTCPFRHRCFLARLAGWGSQPEVLTSGLLHLPLASWVRSPVNDCSNRGKC